MQAQDRIRLQVALTILSQARQLQRGLLQFFPQAHAQLARMRQEWRRQRQAQVDLLGKQFVAENSLAHTQIFTQFFALVFIK
jgi:hypothetical protein